MANKSLVLGDTSGGTLLVESSKDGYGSAVIHISVIKHNKVRSVHLDHKGILELDDFIGEVIKPSEEESFPGAKKGGDTDAGN